MPLFYHRRNEQFARAFLALPVIAFTIAGCVSYRPKPLTRAAVERSLEPPPIKVLRIEAACIRHPRLQPVLLDMRRGIRPDDAAILAVLMSPSVRADRDRRGLAEAQLIQAGILPNPQLSYTRDFVTGGNTAGTVSAYGYSASWDVTSVITRGARIAGAKANIRSVDLDIAWNEWQAAQAAQIAVYKVAAMEQELEIQRDIAGRLEQSEKLVRKAMEQHQKTELDLATAEASSADARSTALTLEQDLNRQRLALKKAIGLPPDAPVQVAEVALPVSLRVPSLSELANNLQDARLDLLALKEGYNSQEAKVREAILAQFPKVGLTFNHASDTTNVHTTGFGISIELPIFDRGQGAIATESATRRKLFDEYSNRVFEARNDIATAISDIQSLNAEIAAGNESLPILKRLVETMRIAVEQRNADVFAYYQAQNNLNQKRIEIVRLREQLAEARNALEIASGCYLPANSHASRL